jgi:hypothetical protein
MRSLLLLALLLTLSLAVDAQAAGRRRAAAANKPSPPSKQAAQGAYGRAVYPKYYWGLHSREFQNIGTPHGDIGNRGDGIQWQPW